MLGIPEQTHFISRDKISSKLEPLPSVLSTIDLNHLGFTCAIPALDKRKRSLDHLENNRSDKKIKQRNIDLNCSHDFTKSTLFENDTKPIEPIFERLIVRAKSQKSIEIDRSPQTKAEPLVLDIINLVDTPIKCPTKDQTDLELKRVQDYSLVQSKYVPVIKSHFDSVAVEEIRKSLQSHEIPEFELSIRIWRYFMSREMKLVNLIDPDLLNNHLTITASSRWIILHWMKEVLVEHKHSRTAFYAAVQLLDIFLSKERFEEDQIQLFAVTAILVALKSYDVEQIAIETLIQFLWDEDTFTCEENIKTKESAIRFLLKFEHKLMQYIGIDAFYPNALDFLRHSYQLASMISPMIQEPILDNLVDTRSELICQGVQQSKSDTMLLIKGIDMLDKVIMDVGSLEFSPSLLAAAVFWKTFPRYELSKLELKHRLLVTTGYSFTQIGSCLKFIKIYTCTDMAEVLQLQPMIQSIEAHAIYNNYFLIEEDQLHSIMVIEDYGNLW